MAAAIEQIMKLATTLHLEGAGVVRFYFHIPLT